MNYLKGNSKMLLDTETISGATENLQEKINLWTEKIPSLKFDKNGRTKIAQLPTISSDDIQSFIYNNYVSQTFKTAFNQYLQDKNYFFKNSDNDYVSYFTSNRNISENDFITNELHFIKNENNETKKVKIKLSKVLASIQDIWIKNNNYTSICNQIKKLRKDGNNFENCTELQELTTQKEELELGNLYISYQKMSNANSGINYLYLSINPLDLLTSSGNTENNPTNFSSCWSQIFNKTENEYIYNLEVKTNYSDFNNHAMSIIAMGKILNRGLLYIKNNNTLKISNDFELLGYKQRTHCYLDNDGLFLEKIYPDKNSSTKNAFIKLLQDNSINVITDDDISEYQCFNIQDYKGNKNYLQIAESYGNLFLDREFFNDDNMLCYLKKDRCGYDYDNGDRIPENEDNENYFTCEECGNRMHIDNMFSDDNGYCYCESCYDDLFAMCEDCNEYHLKSNMTDIGGHYSYKYVCSSCLENYYRCENCNEYINENDIYSNDDGEVYCQSCYDDLYTRCCECDEEILIEDVETIDNECYCSTCYNDKVEELESEEIV